MGIGLPGLRLLVRLIAKLMLGLAEAPFWLLYLLRSLTTFFCDAAKAKKSMTGGTLRCPDGHEIPTDELVVECGQCGFTYRGSILICANPECQAPATPYINCPTCGLSVRAPYRFGH